MKGEGNQQDYGMRVYDPRLGRFLSVDPLSPKYPELTPYQYASNTPIWAIDIDGLESGVVSFDPGVNISRAATADHIQRGVKNWWTDPVTSPYWKQVLRNDEAVLGFPKGTFTTNGDVISAAGMIYVRNAQHAPGRLNLPSTVRAPKAPQEPEVEISQNVSSPKQKVTIAEDVAISQGASTAKKTNTPAADKWADFDFEEYKTVYHKGSLDQGKVSSDRTFSTGTERDAVDKIRGGTLYEFKIPKTVFNDWTRRGLAAPWKDYDFETGVVNEEVRFDPKVAEQLNKYLVK